MPITAHEAGRDCAKIGASALNCHFSFFATPEFTAEWQRGYYGERAGDEGLIDALKAWDMGIAAGELIRDLKSENAKLKRDIVRFNDRCVKIRRELEAEIVDLKSEVGTVTRMRKLQVGDLEQSQTGNAKLLEYVQHNTLCAKAKYTHLDCDCGLDDLLKGADDDT